MSQRFSGILALAIFLTYPWFSEGQTVNPSVKLLVNNGVPQITVDGVAIRPKMFFGYTSVSRSGNTSLGAEWKEVSLDFTAPETDGQVAVHFRFGEDPGEIDFDDFKITDLTDGKNLWTDDFESAKTFKEPWSYWCEDKSGKVSFELTTEAGINHSRGLRIRLEKDAKLKGFHVLFSPIAIVEGHRYALKLQARSKTGKRLAIEVKHQGGDFRLYGGMATPFGSEVRLAAEKGVNWISVEVPTCWSEPGSTPNYSPALRACREVLQNNPRAMMIPRLSVNPPEWWRKANPSELVVFEDGETSPHGSVASEKYRREAGEALRRVIRVLEENFPANLAGYFPTGQNTGEWFYPKAWSDRLTGFEAPMKEAWKNKSGLDLPTAKERQASPFGAIRSPVEEKKVLAFAHFQQDLMADMLLGLAKTIRQETAGKRLTCFFYGYTFECASYYSGAASTGHFALRKLLQSPDIDILAAPVAYNDRAVGGAASCQSVAESVLLAGKLWLNEDDTRTDLAKPFPFGYPGWNSGADRRVDTLGILKRNLLQASIRNLALYWMDLGATGWFNDKALWEEHEKFLRMDELLLKNPTPYRGDTALVVDEESLLHIAGGGASKATVKTLAYEGRSAASRSGATYGQYLLDDVANGKVHAKIYFFQGTTFVGPDLRQKILKNVESASRVWSWAPGYIDGEKFSLESMKELTGFDLAKLSPEISPKVIATSKGLALGLPESFGPTNLVTPLFSAKALASDEVLATFENGEPAVVIRVLPNQTLNVFCGTTEIPTALYRSLARSSGAHIYSDTDVHVWANGPFIGVHGVQDGTIVLRTGPGTIEDVLSGEQIGTGPELKLPLRLGETRVFRLK